MEQQDAEKKAAGVCLEAIELSQEKYRLGNTKVFTHFRCFPFYPTPPFYRKDSSISYSKANSFAYLMTWTSWVFEFSSPLIDQTTTEGLWST